MSAPMTDRVLKARARITSAIARPATSHWLRRALIDALERDPTDARSDAAYCLELIRELEDAVREDAAARAARVEALYAATKACIDAELEVRS